MEVRKIKFQPPFVPKKLYHSMKVNLLLVALFSYKMMFDYTDFLSKLLFKEIKLYTTRLMIA